MQIKMKYHYMLISIAKIQGTTPPNAGEKTMWWFLTKLNSLTIWYSHYAPWQLPKGAENLSPHKHLRMDVYSSFNHNYPNLEATKMSFSR